MESTVLPSGATVRPTTTTALSDRVVAVVVTYNRPALLEQCVRALQQQTTPCDILIINNASTDDTHQRAQAIAATDERIHYENTGANLGGAGGFNYGMKKAAAMGYGYFWLMDDDCLPAKTALEKLMEADKALGGPDKYGYLSSAVLWTDGRECAMNRQKVKKSYYENVHLLDRGIIQVEHSTFVSVLFPIQTVRRVGLPIKEFFIWGDDIEYTRRITVRQGLPGYLAGQSRVTHAMKENTGSNIATDIPERIDRYNYAFRNENYLYRREGFKGFAYYVAKCCLNLCRVLTKAKGRRFKRCFIILRAMLLGLFFNPKIEYIEE